VVSFLTPIVPYYNDIEFVIIFSINHLFTQELHRHFAKESLSGIDGQKVQKVYRMRVLWVQTLEFLDWNEN
jgi:hypothetical protein